MGGVPRRGLSCWKVGGCRPAGRDLKLPFCRAGPRTGSGPAGCAAPSGAAALLRFGERGSPWPGPARLALIGLEGRRQAPGIMGHVPAGPRARRARTAARLGPAGAPGRVGKARVRWAVARRGASRARRAAERRRGVVLGWRARRLEIKLAAPASSREEAETAVQPRDDASSISEACGSLIAKTAVQPPHSLPTTTTAHLAGRRAPHHP